MSQHLLNLNQGNVLACQDRGEQVPDAVKAELLNSGPFTQLAKYAAAFFYYGQLLGLLCQLALEACIFNKKPFFYSIAVL